MWRVPPADELAARWRSAEPFRHVVLDDVVDGEALEGFMEILDDEPVELYESDIFKFDATAPELPAAAFVPPVPLPPLPAVLAPAATIFRSAQWW